VYERKHMLDIHEIHQNLSKSIKIYQNPSKSIKMHQNPSKSIKIHQNPMLVQSLAMSKAKKQKSLPLWLLSIWDSYCS
jgi:hypothetical protein